MITFYDITSKLENKTWNPFTWRTRYALNYKGIPYRTVWIEYPDIEKISKEIGVEATSKKPDGSPFYTVPFIRDESTGVVMSDSMKIVQYLDKTYPDTPKVLPVPGTEALISAFIEAAISKQKPLFPFIMPRITWSLNPISEEYFRKTREPIFGRMEELLPKGEEKAAKWKEAEEAWGGIDAWMDKESTFVMGDIISHADFMLGGALILIRQICGRDSEEWKDVLGWQGGRWARLMQELEKYETVV